MAAPRGDHAVDLEQSQRLAKAGAPHLVAIQEVVERAKVSPVRVMPEVTLDLC